MSTIPPFTSEDYKETIKVWRSFKVSQLKDVCRSLDLRLSGRKQDLIDRGESCLVSKFRSDDHLALHAIRALIFRCLQGEQLPNYQEMIHAIRTGQYQMTTPTLIARNPPTSRLSGIHISDSVPFKGHTLYFKTTPLYLVSRLIHSTPMLLLSNGNRSFLVCYFIFTEDEYKMLQDKTRNYRLYILCGKPNGQRSNSTDNVLIEYPAQTVIYINDHKLSDTYLGIAEKIGTAVPADVTDYMNSPPERNEIKFCHLASGAAYLMYLYIVEVKPAETLIQQVRSWPAIPKNETIKNIKDMSTYDGIQTTKLTLRDPLSYTKLAIPTKSVLCDHYMCFNGLIFIELQRLVETWSCPVCLKTINFNDLRISEYFEEILKNVDAEVDEIIIMQDGSWKVANGDNTNATKKRTESASPEAIVLLSDDEDDILTHEVDANAQLESEEDEEEEENVNNNRVDNILEVEISDTEQNNNQEKLIDSENIQNQDEATDKMEDNNTALSAQQSPQAETNKDATSNMETTFQEDIMPSLPRSGVQEKDTSSGDGIDTEQNLGECQTVQAVDLADSPISVINVTLDPPNESNKERSTESSVPLSNLSSTTRESFPISSSPRSKPPSMITPISPSSAQVASDKSQTSHENSIVSNHLSRTSSPDFAALPLSLTSVNNNHDENRTSQSPNVNKADMLNNQDGNNSQAASDSANTPSLSTIAVSAEIGRAHV